MKYNVKSMVASAICAIFISVVAMIVLVIISSLIAPILGALFIESGYQSWCGVFSRCASATQQSFIEYIWSDAPWNNLNIATIVDRLKRAILGGVFLGIAVMGISVFSNRKK